MFYPESVEKFAIGVTRAFLYEVRKVARREIAHPGNLVAGNRLIQISLYIKDSRGQAMLVRSTGCKVYIYK